MKKKHVIALALCVLLIGGAAALVHLFFPKARPIRCPDSGGVISMTVGKNASKGDIPVDEGDWEDLLSLLSQGRATRKWSLYDAPVNRPYYVLEIRTVERRYRYFIYKSGDWVYIELPYEGIHKGKNRLYEIISTQGENEQVS